MPDVLQVQYSLLDRRPENGMSDFCLQHKIGILPYGVLAGGFLSDKYLGMPSSKWVLISKQGAMLLQQLLLTLYRWSASPAAE